MDAPVTVHEAKTNLSKLLARVEQGEEIVIARGSKPVAKLVRFQQANAPRKLGGDEGLVWMADDFDDELSDELDLLGDDDEILEVAWPPALARHVAEERAKYDVPDESGAVRPAESGE